MGEGGAGEQERRYVGVSTMFGFGFGFGFVCGFVCGEVEVRYIVDIKKGNKKRQ